MQTLSTVLHPGKGEKNIVELGLVQKVDCSVGRVKVVLGFPKRRDPLTDYLVGATKAAIVRDFPEAAMEVVATVVDEAPAPKSTKELDKEQLKDVRHIIAVASGKGGVGKSTVAVNLACALARQGFKVGLADADVYGPSIPVMTGTEGAEIQMEDNLFYPVEKFGVKWMSIGYFAAKGQALIWRGPMACNALKQIVLQTRWEELDYLLIDLPPGTGDIHISLLQDIPVQGAVIVTTPQDVALADVEKGVNMFANPNVARPIYGIVENMAWFTPEEHPDEKYYIFGRNGGVEMARRLGLELLGQIPLVQGIREGGDSGEPSALGTRPDSRAFLELASRLDGKVG